MGTSLDSARRKAAFLGEQAFGVVSSHGGFGLRVQTPSFEDVVKLINPEAAPNVIGDKWEVSGLPIGMGEHSLVLFLEGWKVNPIHTFRQGGRRTWIVRAASPPIADKYQHELGVAWIRQHQPMQAKPKATERWQPSQTK